MKHFFQLILSFSFCLGLVQCNNARLESYDKSIGTLGQLTAGVNKIEYTNSNGLRLIWTLNTKDFIIPYANGCKKGFAQNADDLRVSETYAEIISLINSGSLVQGTGLRTANNLPQVQLTYSSGNIQTIYLTSEFNITNDKNSITNHQELSNYFANLQKQVSYSSMDCSYGK